MQLLEYQSDADDVEATGVLSRQAKYNKKNKKSQFDNTSDEESYDFAENVVDTEPKVDKKKKKHNVREKKLNLKLRKRKAQSL